MKLFRTSANGNPRAGAMRQLAHQLEMDYYHKDEFKDISLLREFRFFRQTTSNRKVYNILERNYGLLETKLQVFDLEWVVSTGKSSQRFCQTMFFIQSKYLALPEFRMQPEYFYHRIGTWLGMQDIDFEAYPDFSKNNLLKGTDEYYIRQKLVTPQFARLFSNNTEWHCEGMGYFLVLYQSKKLLNPHQIMALIKQGTKLYETIKEQGSDLII
jgi:hypothetical protein